MGTFLACADLFRRRAVDGDEDEEDGASGLSFPYAGAALAREDVHTGTGQPGQDLPHREQQGDIQPAIPRALNTAGNSMFEYYCDMLLHPDRLRRGPLLENLLRLQQDAGVS